MQNWLNSFWLPLDRFKYFHPYLVKINRLVQREVKSDYSIEKALFEKIANDKISGRKPPSSQIPIFSLLPIS